MDCPRRFGSYTLLRRIAVGGMAEIYLAKVAGLAGFEKHLVLKVIHPKYAQDPEFVAMLVQEAKLAVRLTHSNIAQVFDLGTEEDRYYIAMEFVDGLDLFQLLRRLRERKLDMPFEVAAFIVSEICAGLDYAHNRKDEAGNPLGIIHRDMSPQNVLVSFDGDVKIIDFGIAKARASSQTTAVGVIKGKFFYMSPEQARGLELDSRSDLFSVGTIFYELLTKRMLYDTESLGDALRLAKQATFLPPSAHRPDIPRDLEALVMKALAPDRELRYPDAASLRSDLNAWVRRTSPGFARHRLESHLRDVCGINTASRVSRMARQEFPVKPQRSMIFHDRPSGEEGVEPLSPHEERTREVASQPRALREPLEESRQKKKRRKGRSISAAQALQRRIREARAALSWSNHGDEASGADRLPKLAHPSDSGELDPTLDLAGSATTKVKFRTDSSGAVVAIERDDGPELLGADAWPLPDDLDTTERDPVRPRRITRPIPTPSSGPHAVRGDGSLDGDEGEDEDLATVIDPGPLERAMADIESIIDRQRITTAELDAPTFEVMSTDEMDVPTFEALATDESKIPTLEKPARNSGVLGAPPPRKTPPPYAPPKPILNGRGPSSVPRPARPAANARPAPPPRSSSPPKRPPGGLQAPPPIPTAAREHRPEPEPKPAPDARPAAKPKSPQPRDRSKRRTPPTASSKRVAAAQGLSPLQWALFLVAALALGAAIVLLVTTSRDGESGEAAANAELGALLITSHPTLGESANAEILIDGQVVGRSTPYRTRLPLDRSYEIRLRIPGQPDFVETDVTLNDRTTELVVFNLLPDTYSALIESVPSGATIVVNNEVLGQTPFTLTGIRLDGSDGLTVLLRRRGFLDAVVTLRWPGSSSHVRHKEHMIRDD